MIGCFVKKNCSRLIGPEFSEGASYYASNNGIIVGLNCSYFNVHEKAKIGSYCIKAFLWQLKVENGTVIENPPDRAARSFISCSSIEKIKGES